MSNDLYRLMQRYGIGSRPMMFADGGAIEDEDTAPPVAATTAPPATPPVAAPILPSSPPPAAAPTLQDMGQRYGINTGGIYGRELAESRRRAQTETEAFYNLINQMSQQTESPTSRAEMYFRLAAAFGAPTRTGLFTENLGLAGREMGEYLRGRRADEGQRRALALRGQEMRVRSAREDVESLRQLAAREITSRAPSAREIRIAEIMQNNNVDRATAANIVDGIEQVIADPVSGTPMIVNRITGRSRPAMMEPMAPPAAAPAPSVAPPADGAAPAPSVPAPAEGAAPARSAEGAAPARPTEGAAPARPAEGAAPPAAERERGRQRTLWEMAPEVTGAVAGGLATAQGITGQLGINVAPEGLVENRQYFINAQGQLIKSLGENPRFPVWEMEKLTREINIAPSAFTDARSLQERMRSIDSYLRTRLQNEINAGNNTNLPVAERRAARAAAENITNFLNILGVPARRGTTGARARQDAQTRGRVNLPAVGEVIDGYRYLGGDPGDRNSWSQESE